MPHEVVGMANQSKNIFVGVGGASMINSSHSLGAFYGMERMMGRDTTPVRQVFDYAKEHFLADLLFGKLPLFFEIPLECLVFRFQLREGLFGAALRIRLFLCPQPGLGPIL